MNIDSELNKIKNTINELDYYQVKILDKFITSDNIFISGPAGTGKSHLIKIIKNLSNKCNKKCSVTALTGCASILLGCDASTIHSWSGIYSDLSLDDNINRIRKKPKKMKNWTRTDILIIDEVSMMSRELFNMLDVIGRTLRKCSDRAFGGIQLILSGDFYQLPPVDDNGEFCFISENWKKIFPRINNLKKIYRQNDTDYKKLLNRVRKGEINSDDREILNKRLIKYKGDVVPTTILSQKHQVIKINSAKHAVLSKKGSKIYRMIIKKPTSKQLIDNNISNHILSKAIKIIKEEENEQVEIKIGDIVICTKNLSSTIVNGSQGKVISIGTYPRVKFINDSEEMDMVPHEVSHGTIIGLSYIQIPLMYAWALTIHKCQGMSLDICQMDLGPNVFEDGQVYVALSRVKELSGLYLTAFDPTKVKSNKLVTKFYEVYRKRDKKDKKKQKRAGGNITKSVDKENMITKITKWIDDSMKECHDKPVSAPKQSVKSTWSQLEDDWIRSRWEDYTKGTSEIYKLWEKYNADKLLDVDKKLYGPFKRRVKRLKTDELEEKERIELDKVPINIHLYQIMKDYFRKKSTEEQRPVFYIITNATLDLIMRKKPLCNKSLLQIKGVGKVFIEKYGADVLKMISKYN